MVPSIIHSTLQFSPAATSVSKQAAEYQLAVSFNLAAGEVAGTARILIPAGETLSLDLGSLKITGHVLIRQDGGNRSVTLPSATSFLIPPANHDRELFLSYTKSLGEGSDNLISEEGIFLLDDWHPVPDRKMRFSLSARLPDDFTAITESDTFPLARRGDTVSATFSQPIHAIHFAAAAFSVSSIKVRQGLETYALFFPEDEPLAQEYLRQAREYILRYEREIGPFPYNHFAIVANRLPTGLGMPTFTLLGQAVLRLPFIKNSSLGHEVLHSWFGNSIEVDQLQGNWCEGLTSYLADHAYRAEAGEGAGHRKEALLNYLSYVNDTNRMPLASFTTTSHYQPFAKARRAVGYSRAMMLFHELRVLLGKETFFKSIKQFYTRFRGKSASWNNIEEIFSLTSGRDLRRFFNERLSRDDLPDLAIEDITSRSSAEGTILSFTIRQKTDLPYQLQIPLRVTTPRGVSWFTITTESSRQPVQFKLDSPPLAFSLDPDYSFFRSLAAGERPPVWSQFMGAANKLVVVADEDAVRDFQPLLDRFRENSWQVQGDTKTGNNRLAESDLLFFGLSGKHAQSLFGVPDHPKEGFTLEVRPNPLNPAHVAVLISSSDIAQTASAAAKLSHYGKYSFLHFVHGRITARKTAQSEDGIHFELEQLPQGSTTSALSSFAAIADQLADNDVIYLGEQHTAMSDHRLQLRLLEAIHARYPDIAIGMEMFPYTSQEALDRYTLLEPEMDEKDFLKTSDYFSVWRYDFRYFRDIFTFARNNTIPVLGLNLPRETVSTVYASGGTDALSEDVKATLPQQRDLSLPGYADQLRIMQSLHQQGGHGSGKVSGFIQAQSLWDETMAEKIADHLQHHPGRKLIVLAGSQHTRKDFGIPPRVARRVNVSQASVLNIFNGSSPENLAEVADFFFLVQPLALPDAAKIGIIINEPTDADTKLLTISDFNPASKAEEAGLRLDDGIVAINDFAIRSMDDVRIALFDAVPGDIVEVKISRTENGFAKEIVYEVELIRPARTKSHP